MGSKFAVPGYDVEFIPVERRLSNRRAPFSQLNPVVSKERRKTSVRRHEDVVDSKSTRA